MSVISKIPSIPGDLHGTTMNLRKFRKATAKKRQLLDKEVYKKKKLRILEKEQEETSDLELSDQTSNTMTLEQFTDIVLASEGVTSTSVNNNNFKEEIIEDKEAEMEKNAMVATILQNKDLTVEVKTAKSKPIGMFSHYSKIQIFVQKFNFDKTTKTPTFSRVFHQNFF